MKGIIREMVGGYPRVGKGPLPKPHSSGPTQMLDIPASGPWGGPV